MKQLVAKYLFLLSFNALIVSFKYSTATPNDHCIVNGCTNYWNFENNFLDQMNQSISLYNYQNISWVNNRLSETNSALYLNNGYIQINSSSVSWTGDFSITAWVFVKTRVSCGKLLDCGIKGQNELVINLNSCNGDGQSLQVYTNRSVSGLVYNRNRLQANKWQHVAFTFNRGKIVIYTDGAPVASGTTNIKPNVSANYGTCFIGKSLWNNHNINAYIDDLWLFNRGLSSDEVQIVMNSSFSFWTTATTRTTSVTKNSTKSTSTTTFASSSTSTTITMTSVTSTTTSVKQSTSSTSTNTSSIYTSTKASTTSSTMATTADSASVTEISATLTNIQTSSTSSTNSIKQMSSTTISATSTTTFTSTPFCSSTMPSSSVVSSTTLKTTNSIWTTATTTIISNVSLTTTTSTQNSMQTSTTTSTSTTLSSSFTSSSSSSTSTFATLASTTSIKQTSITTISITSTTTSTPTSTSTTLSSSLQSSTISQFVESSISSSTQTTTSSTTSTSTISFTITTTTSTGNSIRPSTTTFTASSTSTSTTHSSSFTSSSSFSTSTYTALTSNTTTQTSPSMTNTSTTLFATNTTSNNQTSSTNISSTSTTTYTNTTSHLSSSLTSLSSFNYTTSNKTTIASFSKNSTNSSENLTPKSTVRTSKMINHSSINKSLSSSPTTPSATQNSSLKNSTSTIKSQFTESSNTSSSTEPTIFSTTSTSSSPITRTTSNGNKIYTSTTTTLLTKTSTLLRATKQTSSKTMSATSTTTFRSKSTSAPVSSSFTSSSSNHTTTSLSQQTNTMTATSTTVYISTSTTTSNKSTTKTTTTLNPNDKMMVALSQMKLINHWNFDNNYLDLKSGKPLLIKNTSFIIDRFKKEKSAIEFSFGQMRIPGFYFRGGFSVLVWIFVSSVDATEQRLLHCIDQNKTNSLIFTLQTGNNKYSYFSINDQKLQTSEKLPTKTWVQVGVTLDVNRVVNIWYNGKSVKSALFNEFQQNLTWPECYIGYNSGNADNFNLFLDDLMLFGNGLTEDQVNLVKDNPIIRPSGPFFNWQFNGDYIDGVTASLFSNSTNNFTFVPNRSGQVNSAVFINYGVLKISNCPYTNMDHTTIMFWIFLKTDNTQYIFEFNDYNSRFEMNSTVAYLTIDQKTVSQFALTINVWTHLATTLDSTSLSLYVNGQSMPVNYLFTGIRNTNHQQCRFGRQDLYLKAYIDDAIFFDRSLSASEVQLYMNS